MKKIYLNELKVKSFVTAQQIRGGGNSAYYSNCCIETIIGCQPTREPIASACIC
jgi:hypothetical protein